MSVVPVKTGSFDYSAMLGQDQRSIGLTLKTYNQAKGLATRIHKTAIPDDKAAIIPMYESPAFSSDEVYYIKGPMGRGLQLQPTGQHVAFCAGTGALVFIDLVAHLLVLNAFNGEAKTKAML